MNWSAEFTARFAPINEWHRVDGIEEKFTEAAFENQGLSKYPEARRTIPVVLRHEEEKVVGAVEAVYPAEGWWHARFKLNAARTLSCVAVDVLEVGTPVSPTFIPVSWRDNGASRQYERAWLSDLSILMYSQRPAYRGAGVTFVVGRDLPPSQVSTEELLRRARSLKPIREYIPPPPTFDDELSRLGYRGGDVDAFVTKAQRSPLDRLYEEHMATKRTQPQVLVRHGVGQVLGVR